MLILTSESRAQLIHVLEAELPFTKPPLQDLCSALLTLLLDYEALLAAVRDRVEVATALAEELQAFLDDSDMRIMGDTLRTALHTCLDDDDVRDTASGLFAKLQACLEGGKTRNTAADPMPVGAGKP